MELCWLAASFKVIALDSRLHNTRLWGNGLNVHAVTRRQQAKQSPEPWFVAGSLDGQALSNSVQLEIFSTSHQTFDQQLLSQCVGFLFFCIIGSTERRWPSYRRL